MNAVRCNLVLDSNELCVKGTVSLSAHFTFTRLSPLKGCEGDGYLVRARKAVTQRFKPSAQTLRLMSEFKAMTNLCIEIGLQNEAATLKRLSLIAYHELERFRVPSYYKLCAVSKAAGILASRRKSIRRGHPTKNPHLSSPILTSCYGFKITHEHLRIPIGDQRFEEIPLTKHTQEVISASYVRVDSFTLTDGSLCLSISKEVEEIKEPAGTIGVDRNLCNVTVGNEHAVTYYDLTQAATIAETTTQIIRSFQRNDIRIRKKIASKYGQRRTRRITQLLHQVSKDIVHKAKHDRTAIVFEDISHIRLLYGKGNGQRRGYRRRMSSWPFHEVKRQVEYKAAWEGVPVITLTRSATRGTSVTCFQCGERLQESRRLRRKLWCEKCRRMFDRDEVAVVNIARRGRLRFARSKGEAREAMVSVFNPPVDASKLTTRHEPTS